MKFVAFFVLASPCGAITRKGPGNFQSCHGHGTDISAFWGLAEAQTAS